jgi:hypothetical protein
LGAGFCFLEAWVVAGTFFTSVNEQKIAGISAFFANGFCRRQKDFIMRDFMTRDINWW